MIKTIGKVIVFCLIVIGVLNFHSLNAKAFKAMSMTITTKPLGKIPGEIATTVTSYPWEFVRK
jgi:hypothetical protein